MKRNLRALAYIIDTTIYNGISTPFSTVARAGIEGQKYFNFISDKINGKNPSFTRKIGGYTVGGFAAILGATLGVAKELLNAICTQLNIVVDTLNILLGIGNFTSKSYYEAEKIFNKVNSNVSKEHNIIVNKLIKAGAYLAAAIVYVGSMVTYSPCAKIKNRFGNFMASRIDALSDDNYLAKGDYKATIKNIFFYAPIKLIGETVKNIVGSTISIPVIAIQEALRYYNWGNISKRNSNIAVKAAGAFTGAVAGAVGIVVGTLEGGLDTISYEANEVRNFVDRLGGKRKFNKSGKEVYYNNLNITENYKNFSDELVKNKSLGLSLTR